MTISHQSKCRANRLQASRTNRASHPKPRCPCSKHTSIMPPITQTSHRMKASALAPITRSRIESSLTALMAWRQFPVSVLHAVRVCRYRHGIACPVVADQIRRDDVGALLLGRWVCHPRVISPGRQATPVHQYKSYRGRGGRGGVLWQGGRDRVIEGERESE